MSGWSAVDLHRYLVTGDQLFWIPNGEVLPNHAELVCHHLAQLIRSHGYALWLIDAERSVPVGHATRVVYGRWFVQEHYRVAAAVFRASLGARTTGNLTARGVQLRTAGELFHQICDTEEEARSYLDQQRVKLRPPLPSLADSL